MSQATLDGHPFRINPTSIRWDFRAKTAAKRTVGGKVVQVFGAELGDMTLEGTFGIGGYAEQTAFLERMRALGNRWVQDHTAAPVRLLWPLRGFDFLVYLKDYNSVDGPRSVEIRPNIVAPKWRLTLFIDEDNTGLKKVAQDVFIARLMQGMGWRQTEFNGPMDWAEVEETIGQIGASTVPQYLSMVYGTGDVPTGVQQ